MLLNEIAPNREIKRDGTIPIANINTNIRRQGPSIGTGAQTDVHNHKHRHNEVIKYINVTEDDLAIDVIDLMQHHQHNKHIPRISSAKLLKKPGRDVLVVVMEKLRKIPGEDDSSSVQQKRAIINQLQPDGNIILQPILTFGGTVPQDKNAPVYTEMLYAAMFDFLDYEPPSALRHAFGNKQFVEAMTLFSSGPNEAMDIHTGNLMLRDDNTVVIVDPVIGRRSMSAVNS